MQHEGVGHTAAQSLGAAIRAARKTRFTQEQLAQAVGVDQTTVSRWELGKDFPELKTFIRLEAVLDLPRGALLVTAGLVEGVSGVEQAITADPELTEEQRLLLRMAYRGARALSAGAPGQRTRQ